MSTSTETPPPPHSPSQQQHHANVHAYASNGLEILQAATDAAQNGLTPEQTEALQNAAAEADAQANETTAADAVAAAVGANDVYQQQHQEHHEQHHQHHQEQAQEHHHEASSYVQQHAHLHFQPDGLEASSQFLHDVPTHDTGVAGAPLPSTTDPKRDPTVNPKLTRLRRACDMCSMRKVKCDDTVRPCKPCSDLGVDCTYNRETKRRGPPNKHAEAAKAAKRARHELLPSTHGFAVAQPPSNGLKASPGSGFSEGLSDAEVIAPMPVLELLVDDFFTYIHPLAPFPHEPTFRQSFANREDRTRPEFLGLIASMVCALVASFPRSAREHLKAKHSTHLFPRAIVLIEKCQDIALKARGDKWQLKQPKTLDDAATSYFLGLASGYIHHYNAYNHFMSETLTLIRELGFKRPKHPGELPTFGNDPYSPEPQPFNHVKDQIGKRIFWCLLLGIR